MISDPEREIKWVNVRVRIDPTVGLAAARSVAALVGFVEAPAEPNCLHGCVPEECVAALLAAPGIVAVDPIAEGPP